MCQHILNVRNLVYYFTVRCSDEYISNTDLLYSCHLRFNHDWLTYIDSYYDRYVNARCVMASSRNVEWLVVE